MKTIAALWGLSLTLSISAFGVMVAADRKLGMPLPYSMPIAYGSMLVIAPLIFLIANRVRSRRPIIMHITPAPMAEPQPARSAKTGPRPVRAEGVVLLDLSNGKGRAA